MIQPNIDIVPGYVSREATAYKLSNAGDELKEISWYIIIY